MMGGQQPAVPSAYARVDYVNGRMKDTESSLRAFREDYRKLCTILSEMQKNLDERMKNCEARITVQDTAIASLQMKITENSGSKQAELKKPEPPKETAANWLHVTEAVRICKKEYGGKCLFSDVSRALIWAGYLDKQSNPKGNSYFYSLTRKGEEEKIIHVPSYNKTLFRINPKKLDQLAEIIHEYCDWFDNARREK